MQTAGLYTFSNSDYIFYYHWLQWLLLVLTDWPAQPTGYCTLLQCYRVPLGLHLDQKCLGINYELQVSPQVDTYVPPRMKRCAAAQHMIQHLGFDMCSTATG
jgi:hypothetical protein